MALPGMRHSFAAKAPASTPSGPHAGLFTALSVMALPGGRRVFVAKSGAIVPAPSKQASGGGSWFPVPDPYAQAKREDEDLLTLLAAIVPILN